MNNQQKKNYIRNVVVTPPPLAAGLSCANSRALRDVFYTSIHTCCAGPTVGPIGAYDVLGLPRRRFPFTFPCIIHFTSSHPPSLIVWPNKESLRRAPNPNSCVFKALVLKQLMNCTRQQCILNILLYGKQSVMTCNPICITNVRACT